MEMNLANRAKPKTKTKAAKGKVKGAAIATLPKAARGKKGHNSQMAGLSDAEVKVELGKLDRLYSNWEKDADVAKQTLGVYRSALKAAKKNGIDTDAYVGARDKNRADHGKVITQAANEGRYLRVMNSPLATQMMLFQNLEEPAPAVDVALQGQMAGKGGEPESNNPYVPGSDDFAIWDENHKLGVAQVKKEMTPGNKAALN